MGEIGNQSKEGLSVVQVGLIALNSFTWIAGFAALILFFMAESESFQSEDIYLRYSTWMWIAVGAFLAFLTAYKVLRSRFEFSYKNGIVRQAAAGLPGSFHYYGKKGLERSYVEKTGFITLGNVFRSEDLVEGTYRGISFRRADVYTSEARKGQATKVYMKGAWFIFSYKKPFTSELRIVSNDYPQDNGKSPLLSKNPPLARNSEYRSKVATVNPAFDASFRCTAKNEEEAVFLLSPQMTQLMVDLRRKLGCPMLAAVHNNQLVLVLCTDRDHMETRITEPLDTQAEIERTREELDIACSLIDAFRIEEEATM